ncbi:MAG TPA: LuxR C-terminal-related transcriptional regulator [Candidatus Sulfotelmatobacter sp.]|nr:LuxR C-terminal-related transcriptional regulator [Candidatus Sulfotelmatobacter sp.]
MTTARIGAAVSAALVIHPGLALREATDFWARGAFERCLEALDALEASGGLVAGTATAADALILRARALLRLRRYSETLARLDAATVTTIEDAARVQLQRAAALTRTGDVERALDMLAELRRTPGALDNPRLAAECAYREAVMHWVLGAEDASVHAALTCEAFDDPHWSVSSREVRAWWRQRHGDYPAALRLLRDALAAYDRGREHDRDDHHELLLVAHVAALELHLRSAGVAGAYVARREAGLDYTASLVSRRLASTVCGVDAWLAALNGDRPAAFRLLRRAVDLNPEPERSIWPMATRAVVMDLLDNGEAAADVAAEGLSYARRIDWAQMTEGQAYGPLFLAEFFARRNPAVARELLGMYELAVKTIEQYSTNVDDRRNAGMYAFVSGLIRRTEGDHAGAHRDLLDASRLFASVTFLWREVHALIELDTVPVPDGDAAELLERAVQAVRFHFPRSFLADLLGPWLRAYDDPVTAAFSPMRRQILRRLLDGVKPKEIAALLGLAIGTVRNHIGEIQAAFGVHSMQGLLVAARLRGLGPPQSWNR